MKLLSLKFALVLEIDYFRLFLGTRHYEVFCWMQISQSNHPRSEYLFSHEGENQIFSIELLAFTDMPRLNYLRLSIFLVK